MAMTKQAIIDQLKEQLSTCQRNLGTANVELRRMQQDADIQRRQRKICMEVAKREARVLGRPVTVKVH